MKINRVPATPTPQLNLYIDEGDIFPIVPLYEDIHISNSRENTISLCNVTNDNETDLIALLLIRCSSNGSSVGNCIYS